MGRSRGAPEARIGQAPVVRIQVVYSAAERELGLELENALAAEGAEAATHVLAEPDENGPVAALAHHLVEIEGAVDPEAAGLALLGTGDAALAGALVGAKAQVPVFALAEGGAPAGEVDNSALIELLADLRVPGDAVGAAAAIVQRLRAS